MMTPQLARQQLELINRRTLRYPLPIAEKDYYLALAVELIHQTAFDEALVFKGGTALHHCYLSQKRFSEDLDFTSLDKTISVEQVTKVLESSGLFRVNRSHQSDFTIKIERLQYRGLLGQPGNIKVEIDIHQNVVLPSKSVVYQNVWQVDTRIAAMDELEICAEKIRAVSQRARYRDFYDLYHLVMKKNINLQEAVLLLREKEIRTPIIAKNISRNWAVAKMQKNRDLGSIYCSESVLDQEIEIMTSHLQFNDIQ